MASKRGYDQRLLTLFDGYVHGKLTRRQFLDRAAAFTAAGTSAAAVLAALAPDYSLAEQVSPDDPSISTSYKKYGSPRGAGVMNGYHAGQFVLYDSRARVIAIHDAGAAW